MKALLSILLTTLIITLTVTLSPVRSYPTQYTLAPGDKLEINIIGHKNLNTTQTIDPDGKISLPMLGILSVTGKTRHELHTELTEAYLPYIKTPQLVIILTTRPIYIVQNNLRNNTWKIHEAKTKEEARAYIGSDTSKALVLDSLGPAAKVTGTMESHTLRHGDIISVNMENEPDFLEKNWYKLITATAVIIGITQAVGR